MLSEALRLTRQIWADPLAMVPAELFHSTAILIGIAGVLAYAVGQATGLL